MLSRRGAPSCSNRARERHMTAKCVMSLLCTKLTGHVTGKVAEETLCNTKLSQAYLVSIKCVGVVVLSIVRLVFQLPDPGIGRLALVSAALYCCCAIVGPPVLAHVRQYLHST